MDPLKVLLCASRTSYLVSSLILWFDCDVKYSKKEEWTTKKKNSNTVSEKEDGCLQSGVHDHGGPGSESLAQCF